MLQSTFTTLSQLFSKLAAPVREEGLPSILYKFVAPENCAFWLQNRTLAFPSLRNLNDPYESLILTLKYNGAGATHMEDRSAVWLRGLGDCENPGYDPEDRSRRISEQQSRNTALESQHGQWLSKIDKMGILSLTRTTNSMVMWAHYARNSSGLCFGIDVDAAGLIEAEVDEGTFEDPWYVLPIRYGGAPATAQVASERQFVEMALGQKHVDWKYEREVRLVRPLGSFREASKNGEIGIVKLNPLWVRDIIVGVMPDSDVLTMLRDNWPAFNHAKLSQLTLDPQSYRSGRRCLEHPAQVNEPELYPIARSGV